MIKFINKEDVLSLRSIVLRESKRKPEDCVFENDDAADSFHLGYLINDEVICVASFHHQSRAGFEGIAYQLRGMATAEAFRNNGYGNLLVNFSITYLRGQKVNYVWCNAREKAFKFYQSLGFEFISEEFDIPGIGPHKTMYCKIQ